MCLLKKKLSLKRSILIKINYINVNFYLYFSEPISLQQKLLGCFRINIKFSEEKWTMSQQPTTLSCFTYCENKGRIVSGYRNYDKQCFCGEFTSK